MCCDTFLDLALLESLDADFGASGAGAWFDAEGDARLPASVVDALAMLATDIGLAGEVTELPTPWVSGRSITSASSCVVRWW